MAATEYEGVWVVADIDAAEIDSSTLEALAAARGLADKKDCRVTCLLMGAGVTRAVEAAYAHGADRCLVVEDPRLDSFDDETLANVIARLIEKHKPEIVLAAATIRGRSLVPRVAVLVGTGASADCIALKIDGETGGLRQTRPVYGGNKISTVVFGDSRPQICTIRPKAYDPLQPDPGRSGETVAETVEDGDLSTAKKIIETIREEGGEMKLADAEIIVSGGRGMKGPEGFDLLQKLARSLGGAVGASRAAVDAGWVSYPHQVGQTGQTVTTRVYIACGISGQVQHLVGMQSSDFIVAINKDPEAPIMKLADIAVVGDAFEIIPELVKSLGA